MRVIRCLTYLFLGLLLTGCTSKPAPSTTVSGDGAGADRTSVILQLNWFPEAEHGGFYTALLEGHYAREGLDVEIRPGGNAAPIATELVAGRVQFAVANAEDVVKYRGQGADVVAVMAAAQHHPRCLMFRADSGVKSFEDLKGKTLQVQSGHAFVEFLRSRGLLEGVTEVPYAGGVALTINDPNMGQQAYIYSEPFVAKQQGAEVVNLMVSDLGFDPYSSILMTSDAMLKEQPELVRKMVRASVAGWRQYLERPESTNQHLLKINPEGVTAEMLTFGVEHLRKMCIPADQGLEAVGSMTKDRWEQLVAQMVNIDPEIRGNVTPDACYRLEYLLPSP